MQLGMIGLGRMGGNIVRRLMKRGHSAVVYDKEVRGHRVWRQRNISLVGLGRSLCVVGYAPAEFWRKKKSNPTRVLMDAVLSSVIVR